MCHIQCVPCENCAQVNKSSCLNPRDTMKMKDVRNSPYEIFLLFKHYCLRFELVYQYILRKMALMFLFLQNQFDVQVC